MDTAIRRLSEHFFTLSVENLLTFAAWLLFNGKQDRRLATLRFHSAGISIASLETVACMRSTEEAKQT